MKVLVGMSGGMDSSVAAYLLKQQGYEVEGITMIIWKKDSPYPAPASPDSCYSPDKTKDLERIREISEKIGIRHFTVDCSDLFESSVLASFRSEYLGGRTPNPCIWCNQKVKFGAMVDYARSILQFDAFATGHYARVMKLPSGRYGLLKAADKKKDQSYFLSRLSQEQLSWTLFPLGGYRKSEIREMDELLGFHPAGQAESQDFYGGDYSDLLGTKDRDGEIIMEYGRVLGHHHGYWHYTIGQRKGLGIAYSEPLYVVSIEPETNRVVVGTEKSTHSERILASDPVFVSADDFDEDTVYTVKIRSMSEGAPARVRRTDGGIEIRFTESVRGAAPGQSAVVYDGDMVIASAVIEFAS